MYLYYDLPVFKDVYALTLRLFQLTQNFSREYKFTRGLPGGATPAVFSYFLNKSL